MLKRMQGVESDEEDGEGEEGGGQKSLEGMTEEEQMASLMGFGGFDTTKGKAVEDNKSSAAKGHVVGRATSRRHSPLARVNKCKHPNHQTPRAATLRRSSTPPATRTRTRRRNTSGASTSST